MHVTGLSALSAECEKLRAVFKPVRIVLIGSNWIIESNKCRSGQCGKFVKW